MIVCTVGPSVSDGTVVRWFRSEIAADSATVMVSASRTGVVIGDGLIDGQVPAAVLDRARLAHQVLAAGGSSDDLVSWATHRHERTFGGPVVPVARRGGRR